MRIIAGTKKGMKLLPPKGNDTRPITDRVKESLFSILYTKGMLEDMVVADLFCGTGSMGLEALSRGAKFCTKRPAFWPSPRPSVPTSSRSVPLPRRSMAVMISSSATRLTR
ncbi:MAG: RsmD family RNA methyltransferase [Planctomycetota bacterium]